MSIRRRLRFLQRRRSSRGPHVGAASVGFVSLICCLASPGSATAEPSACAALAGQTIPESAFRLPTHGAAITTATLVAAVPAATGSKGDYTPALPEYCKVIGAIKPIDRSAPDVTFEVNIPTDWNRKLIQYGGGGLNGTLVTGLGALRDAPPDVPPPLARGYATLGTDAGHRASDLPEPAAFATNEEALTNYAYAAYKKAHDAATEVVKHLRGSGPMRVYYFGGSTGGREALAMAQRFPADYDGIVSVVPVISFTGLQHAGNRAGVLQQNGGWLNPAKINLLGKAVVEACDALDGLGDGIISNPERCRFVFDPATLRCADGRDTGDTCLSDRQISAVKVLHAPYVFPFPLANGITSYPGFGYGGEAQPGGYEQGVSGVGPPEFPPVPDRRYGQLWTLGNAIIRYFFAGGAHTNPMAYSPELYAARVRRVSELMDDTDPDLSGFLKRGGKLIIKENMADHAQSPYAGISYYESVVSKLGRAATDRFVRLYTHPGVNHGGTGVSLTTAAAIPRYVDLLGLLEKWVEEGKAPPDTLIATAQAAAPPFAATMSRPICRYPNYPRYRGAGDPNTASSFTCVPATGSSAPVH